LGSPNVKRAFFFSYGFQLFRPLLSCLVDPVSPFFPSQSAHPPPSLSGGWDGPPPTRGLGNVPMSVCLGLCAAAPMPPGTQCGVCTPAHLFLSGPFKGGLMHPLRFFLSGTPCFFLPTWHQSWALFSIWFFVSYPAGTCVFCLLALDRVRKAGPFALASHSTRTGPFPLS